MQPFYYKGVMHKQHTLFLLTGLVLTATAEAREIAAPDSLLTMSIEELTQVKVIIATGLEQTKSNAPATVTLITEDDIKKTGATNLADVLQTVPGINIRHSAFGYRPEVRIRGSAGTQTLLMINGNPIRDLVWNFGLFWKGIPATAIERVEVIRGPGSALYGADASAGVINVITKTTGTISKNEAGIRAGSFDSQDGWVQYGDQWHDFNIAFTADYSTTDGDIPGINNFNNVAYGYDNQDIRFSMANKNWQFLANYMHHNNLDTQITGAGFYDPVTSADDNRYDLDLIYTDNNFSDNWGIKTKLHYQDLNYDSNKGFRETPPDNQFPEGRLNQMSSSERQARFDFLANFSGFSQHTITLGSGYNWQDIYKVDQIVNFDINNNYMPPTNITGTDRAFTPEKSREISYALIQDIWSFAPNWELTAGLRYDHYSDFGDTFNPRLALVWQTTEKLTTKFLYGQAFRAPNFQELYATTSRSIGNPNLDPEETETLEVAFSYHLNPQVQLNTIIYQYTIDKFIRSDSNSVFQNTGKHKITGIEMEAGWQINNQLKFSGNYTWRDPENNEYRVSEEPEQSAYLRSDWQFKPGWNWDIQANWIADRKRADTDTRSNMDNYAITDTTLRYTGLKKWEFAASVRNVFDENAKDQANIRTATGYKADLPLMGRNAYAEIRYKF